MSRWWILGAVVVASMVAVVLAVTQGGDTHKGGRSVASPRSSAVAPPTPSIARVTAVSQGCVVFSRGGPDGGLHVVGTDGTLRRLTTEAGDWGPVWSPDGTKIVFERDIKGQQDVYLMLANGSGLTRLTTGGSSAKPTWSANGSRILFGRGVPGRSDFYTINSDGTGLRRLTEGRRDDAAPVWSPDGSTIVFVGSGPRNLSLYLMNAHGSGRKRIGGDLNSAWPQWSPDGHKIAFVNEDDGSIELINPDGSRLRKVFDVTALPDATGPNFTVSAWSPDGMKIVFAAGNPQTSHLYIVNVDGSGIEQLTTGPVTDETPDWSATTKCR